LRAPERCVAISQIYAKFDRKCTVNCSPYVPVLKLSYGKGFKRDSR